MNPLELILLALTAYLVLGVLFAIPFAVVGAGRIDPVARSGSLAFRLLIVPGAVLLWPALAIMWLRSRRAVEP